MADNDNGHHEPTSPRRVAADMLVIIILLAGAFAAETIKAYVPHGVPLVITAILTVSELTLAVYFLVVFARAFGYAFREVDKIQESVGGTRTWQMSKRSLAALLAVLRDALPSAKDFNRALRFGVRFIAALAFIGAALLIAVNYDFAAGGDSGPETHGEGHAPDGGGLAKNTHSLPDSSHGPPQPAPNRDGPTREGSGATTGESAPATPDKQPRAASASESKEGGSEQESREELKSQLEKVNRDTALLERRRAELIRSLESDLAKSEPQAEPRARRPSTTAGRKGRPNTRAKPHQRRHPPNAQSEVRPRERPEPDPFEHRTFESLPMQGREVAPMPMPSSGDAVPEVAEIRYDHLQPKSALAAAVYNLALAVQNYRLHIVAGALAAALLTLFASLTALARRAARKEA